MACGCGCGTPIPEFTKHGYPRRYVHRHYRTPKFTPEQIAERLWSNVIKTDSCWLWTGTTTNGYGKCGSGTRWAHRTSYELHSGPIPAGFSVLHRCDVKACVNPDHLFLGTQTDNMRDMIRKRRAPRQLLTLDDVQVIRREYRRGVGGVMARRFGVSPSTIHAVVARRIWTWEP